MNLYHVRQSILEFDSLTEELKLLPTGCIIAHHRGLRTYYSHQFYHAGKRIQKYIRKCDLQTMLKKLQRRREILARLRQLRTLLKHHCKLIHIVRKEQQKDREYESLRLAARSAADDLPFGEHCLHRTLRGEYVASKSEVILADYYYLLGIPYLYSPPLRLEGRTYYPDFVISINGMQIYHEHLGVLEDEDYARRWHNKYGVYRRNGIVEHINLICTREVNGIIDMSEIDRLFRKWGVRK